MDAAIELKRENDYNQDEEHQNQSWQKIELVVTKLKNRKVLGLDNIHNKLLKFGGDASNDKMQILLNKKTFLSLTKRGNKTSILVFLFENYKGEQMDPQNYRGNS